MSRILFLTLSIVCMCFASFAQRGNHTYTINPTTKQVSNFITQYNFTHVYSKTFESEQSLRTYRANTIITFQILGDGTGKLIKNIDGQKTELLVNSCFKYDDCYRLEATSFDGIPTAVNLYLKDKHIEQLTLETANDITVFFYTK